MNKKWLLIYVKPNSIKKVIATLGRKNIRCFVAQTKKDQKERGRKVGLEPLFPGFVFVFISNEESKVVKQIDSVISFVYWLTNPAVFNNSEIEQVRWFTHQFSNISVSKISVDTNGHTQKINEYANADNIGKTGKFKYKLQLPVLGYVMTAEKDKPTAGSVDTIYRKYLFAS